MFDSLYIVLPIRQPRGTLGPILAGAARLPALYVIATLVAGLPGAFCSGLGLAAARTGRRPGRPNHRLFRGLVRSRGGGAGEPAALDDPDNDRHATARGRI